MISLCITALFAMALALLNRLATVADSDNLLLVCTQFADGRKQVARVRKRLIASDQSWARMTLSVSCRTPCMPAFLLTWLVTPVHCMRTMTEPVLQPCSCFLAIFQLTALKIG